MKIESSEFKRNRPQPKEKQTLSVEIPPQTLERKL
jgi:hypothetical protein